MSYQEIDKLTEARASTFAFSDSDSESILFPVDDTHLVLDSAASASKRLEQLLKKETRMNLHGSTLSQYWRNKRIPRGLRINKEPTLGRQNDAFCKKWCEVLNKCSLDLMLLLIEFTNEELLKTRSELTELRNDLKGLLSTQQLKEIEEQCKTMITTYEQELAEIKLNKYRRDTLDYKKDLVYVWLSGTKTPRYSQQRDDYGSSSDLSADEVTRDNRRRLNRSQPGPVPFRGAPQRAIQTRSWAAERDTGQPAGGGRDNVQGRGARRGGRGRT